MGHIEVFRGDNGALIVNASAIELHDVATAAQQVPESAETRQIMSAMASWAGAQQPKGRRLQGIFDRDAYLQPNSPYDKMRVARLAMSRDDIVGRAARMTESLALRRVEVRCTGDDLDQTDVWNQIAGDLNLDARLREMWQVMFTDSQVVVATWWGEKTYTSRRLTKTGQASRKTYDLTVPLALSLIDTTKVTPIGALMFNQERLAYVANEVEAQYLDAALAGRAGLPAPAPRRGARQRSTTMIRTDDGRNMLSATVPESGLPLIDPIVSRLITNRYEPDDIEAQQLRADGVDPTHLFAFDPRYVWRHTKTRPQFQRFANVDLEPVFELLDLKHQLRQVDRAHLIGGANYIVLVTKGSDKNPAKQGEIDNLRAHVRTLGQIPVLVGDHRLNVEIVTPKQDHVLDQKKHDTLDVRITAAVYGMFAAAGEGVDDPLKAGRIIATGLESERLLLRRSLEAELFDAIRRSNPKLTQRAKLTFLPGTISLAFDSAWATFLLDMREARQISRDTLLSQMDFDQADEAGLLQMEAEEYDGIFKEQVPHGANPAAPDAPMTPGEQKRAGRRGGGNRNGGGAAPGTRQGQESVDVRRSDTGPNRKPRADVALAVAEQLGVDLAEDLQTFGHQLDELNRDQLIAAAGAVNDPVPNRHRMRAPHTRAALAALAEQDDD